MAMRHQRGGRHGPSRPRIGARPVYEEFKPVMEWRHDGKSNNLLVYLPGFTREQLKVSTEGTNTLRIRGEHLVGGNKWSRFQEDVTIPGDCDIRSIRAKYEGGVLIITMPKIDTASSSSHPGSKHEAEAKPAPTKPEAALPLPPPPLRLPSPPRQHVQPSTHDKPKFEDVEKVPRTVDGNGKKTLSSSSSSSTSSSSSDDEKKKKKVAPAAVETSKSPPKTGVKGREAQFPTVATDNRNNVIGKQTEKITETAPPSGAADTKEKKREDTTAATSSGGAFSAAPGGIGGLNLDKYKRAVKTKLVNTTQLKEERQLLVNMGVAVLVIVSLGAYIAYSYGPSRKD